MNFDVDHKNDIKTEYPQKSKFQVCSRDTYIKAINFPIV